MDTIFLIIGFFVVIILNIATIIDTAKAIKKLNKLHERLDINSKELKKGIDKYLNNLKNEIKNI